MEVGVFDPRAVEVWRGESPSMEGSGILTISLASHSHKVSIFSDAAVGDKPGHLSMSFLIEENDGVEMRL